MCKNQYVYRFRHSVESRIRVYEISEYQKLCDKVNIGKCVIQCGVVRCEISESM